MTSDSTARYNYINLFCSVRRPRVLPFDIAYAVQAVAINCDEAFFLNVIMVL